ncbi:DMT family transporter [Anaerovorax odorimutans]|uniref:DMT family transporter n=1 Tax=Anaerovorax odorimutans TaxID=109327 RepID=A0ABT1RT49_9FIRM|nr:DMT family transporter [Anaerovorax odorimutans]MCQ4638392.1 DMT family transporter [Anaerovorax odorimutans]
MKKHSEHRPFFYGGLILLQCFIWGVGNPITKISVETIPPFYCMGIRFTLAFALFMLVFGHKIIPQFKKAYIPDCVVIGLFTAASFIFSTFALHLTDATIVGFLLAFSVVFTPILSFFILKQKISGKFALIILLVVVGLYFLCANGGSFTFGIGELMALLSALAGAGMLIYSSKHVSDIGPLALSASQCAVTAAVSFFFAVIFEDVRDLSQAAPEGWAAVIYLAVGCTCVAYILQNIALRKVSATFVSLAFCTEPVFTAIAAFFILGERLSPFGLAGALLIAVGIAMASLLPSSENDIAKKKDEQ